MKIHKKVKSLKQHSFHFPLDSDVKYFFPEEVGAYFFIQEFRDGHIPPFKLMVKSDYILGDAAKGEERDIFIAIGIFEHKDCSDIDLEKIIECVHEDLEVCKTYPFSTREERETSIRERERFLECAKKLLK